MVVATMAGFIAKLLKQPTIPAYVLTGILLGPILGLIKDPTNIASLSEIGIAFLLFIVGLELDLRKLKDTGNVALVGGLLRTAALFLLGYFAGLLFGFTHLQAVYTGLIISFSSTMVVVKLLSDKHELDTLHGRIVIGTLLLQDIIVILALSMLGTVGRGGFLDALISLTSGVGLIIIAFFAGKAFFPILFRKAAEDVELLFLMAVSVCLFMSMIFTFFGFSIVVGAFVAGVILGNLPYNIEIISKINPLKDFFSVLFFSSMGLELQLIDFTKILSPLVVLTIIVIVVSPLITIIITSLFGYKKRTSFLTGISLAQISAFSLIIVNQGYILGHVTDEFFGLTLLLALITMTLTTYLLAFDDKIYDKFSKYLAIFEKLSKNTKELHNLDEDSKHDVILVGFDRTGYSILQTLRKLKKNFIVVDFDPDVIKHLIERKIPCIYGDIGDQEILRRLKLHQVNMIISTVPNHHENLLLLETIKKHNKHATIIVTSYRSDEALELYEKGASYVIIPHFLGGEHVSLMLESVTNNLDQLIQTKLTHIAELKRREEIRPKKTKFLGSIKK